jgi:hypothetical protein
MVIVMYQNNLILGMGIMIIVIAHNKSYLHYMINIMMIIPIIHKELKSNNPKTYAITIQINLILTRKNKQLENNKK